MVNFVHITFFYRYTYILRVVIEFYLCMYMYVYVCHVMYLSCIGMHVYVCAYMYGVYCSKH